MMGNQSPGPFGPRPHQTSIFYTLIIEQTRQHHRDQSFPGSLPEPKFKEVRLEDLYLNDIINITRFKTRFPLWIRKSTLRTSRWIFLFFREPYRFLKKQLMRPLGTGVAKPLALVTFFSYKCQRFGNPCASIIEFRHIPEPPLDLPIWDETMRDRCRIKFCVDPALN